MSGSGRRWAPWAGRGGSLRWRLTAGMVLVLLVAGLVVGAVSELFLRQALLSRLDEQLVAAGGRYAASLEQPHRGEDQEPPEYDADDVIPGLAQGTLGVRIAGGGIRAASIVGQDGTAHAVTLDANSTADLLRVRPGAGAQSVDLAGLGDYRVRALRGPAGDVQVTGLPLHPVNRTLVQLLVVEVALFALLVGAGGVAAAYVVRRSLRPLDQLAQTALKVSTLALTGGDEPLPTTATTRQTATREVDQVSEAFDRMLERVRTAMAARDATEARLRQFIADASHELRTPLATIRASAEYGATAPKPLPEQTADALARIRAAAERMGLLVADLLLLARLDAGRPLRRLPVDLTRLVLDTVSEVSAAAPDHRWELDLPEAQAVVDGDEERLRQVLGNLLSNARTHTPAGTTVTTGIAVGDGEVRMWVADDGPGVPQAMGKEIFERFTRGDTSRSRAHGSTGLGLAIAHSIVRAHGGSLVYEPAPGAGACFTVALPRSGGAGPV